VVHETVYENRFGYTETLNEMGADITLFRQCLGGKHCRFASQSFSHSLIVKGVSQLVAKDISIPDLRAGFAYVMAAVLADGTSTISGLHFLDRGYEDLTQKLLGLGVDAVRESADEGVKPAVAEALETVPVHRCLSH
jgi:UDP-N-acetylglucosamine 1-carboxyvinyltransferase